jgi:hypothetical protein
MAQVMQPHVIELGSLADTPPRLLEVHEVPSRLLSANHVGIALKTGNGLQQCERWRIQVDSLASRFAIGKRETFMFLTDVLPSQRQDFVAPRSCKREQADCSDDPRRTTFVLFRLAQSVT